MTGTAITAIKEKVRLLSLLQQKILFLVYENMLCSQKILLTKGFLKQQNCSCALKTLIEKGYVAKKKKGRKVIYWIGHPAVIKMFDENSVRFGSTCCLPIN